MTEIEQFLQQVRNAISVGNTGILSRRHKYMATVAQLGITSKDVWDDIYNLSPNDNWTKDADDNPAYSGFVWYTKKMLHGQMIYIKLKIKNELNGKLLVMSYHIDETV